MKISVKNLGVVDEAEIELGKITVLCGRNNTGKTYITYALYGFLRNWRTLLAESSLHKLFSQEDFPINLQTLVADQIHEYMREFSEAYTKTIHKVFGAASEKFRDSQVSFQVPEIPDITDIVYERSIRSSSREMSSEGLDTTLTKTQDSSYLDFATTQETHTWESVEAKRLRLARVVFFLDTAIGTIVFAPLLPNAFIASAERTGIATFKNQLDFSRGVVLNSLFDKIELPQPKIRGFLERIRFSYATPIQDNIVSSGNMSSYFNEESFLATETDILSDFADIIGGTYHLENDLAYYQPTQSNTRLAMNEVSSGVRALLAVGFWLRHQAKPGDLLMIDEPELSLHPHSQRRLARLLVRLANQGMKVFVTTHSDYIVKEMNTLIMLHGKGNAGKQMQAQYGYKDSELLNPEDIKLYFSTTKQRINQEGGEPATIRTFEAAPISPIYGIEVASFDQDIDEMNTIQQEILFGDA
jgi:ABC-type branched-subunit amino acid transport system ATPase component